MISKLRGHFANCAYCQIARNSGNDSWLGILIIGLGLKAKFLGLGLGTVRPWPLSLWPWPWVLWLWHKSQGHLQCSGGARVCRPGQTSVLPPRKSDQFCNQRIF